MHSHCHNEVLDHCNESSTESGEEMLTKQQRPRKPRQTLLKTSYINLIPTTQSTLISTPNSNSWARITWRARPRLWLLAQQATSTTLERHWKWLEQAPSEAGLTERQGKNLFVTAPVVMLHYVRHLNKTQSAPFSDRCNFLRYYYWFLWRFRRRRRCRLRKTRVSWRTRWWPSGSISLSRERDIILLVELCIWCKFILGLEWGFSGHRSLQSQI